MNSILSAATALSSCFIALGCWLGWQLLRQNGRILLRRDELEKRLHNAKELVAAQARFE